MLPDFTETKRLFAEFFQTYARQKARAMSPFADVEVRYLHEGRGMKVVRADHSESTSGVQELSSIMELKIEEIPELTFEKAIGKYDEMILDMVRKQTGFALGRLNDDIPASQSVDARGKKLDAKIMLQMLETIQMEFYPDGRPHELHVVGELFSQERLKAIEDEISNSPDLQKQYDELIERKREDWRAREASRKLVG